MATKKLKTQYNYDRIGEFSEGRAIVCLNGKYGFIDTDGKEVIPPYYDYACDFQQGNANVKFKNKWRVIDRDGKVITKFDEIEFASQEKSNNNFSEDIQEKSNNNFSEDIISKYNEVKILKDGFAKVRLGKKWGLINEAGIEVVAPIYSEIRKLANGFVQIRVDDKWGLINESGNEIVEPVYYNPSSVFKSTFGGFIDKSGNKQQFEWD